MPPPVPGYQWMSLSSPEGQFLVDKAKARIRIVETLCKSLRDYLCFSDDDLLVQEERERQHPESIVCPPSMAQAYAEEDLVKACAQVDQLQQAVDRLNGVIEKFNGSDDAYAALVSGSQLMLASLEPQLQMAKDHMRFVQQALESREGQAKAGK